MAEYSFLGYDPASTIKVKNHKVIFKNREDGDEVEMETRDPLALLKKIISAKRIGNDGFRFLGGAVGYLSYDAVRYWERLPETAFDDLNFPDIEVDIYEDGIIFDHINRRTFYYYHDKSRYGELVKSTEDTVEEGSFSYSEPKVSITKDHYEKVVEEAKEYILSGDVFQVVLSKRLDLKFHGSLVQFYENLRTINPSPYMYFLKMGERQIVGASPEMLVRVDRGIVETFPIAGTRPHVEDPKRNEALSKDLLDDPKERAEHVMLVDLARNDIGKVAEYGTVKVPEFMEVHQYSHVQHLVSRVTGKLRDDKDCFDTIRAVFPAGTVSGAPKVRAMEIIDELEPTRRGPYAGAIGYFSYNGNADFAITIRTLVAEKERCHIQVGSGLVADSIPENEWYETENKVMALRMALELTEENSK